MITIVCVTTANYKLSNFAINETIKNLPLESKVLTFSDRPIHPNEKLIKISKLNGALDYNTFMLKNLSQYITTSHFIVVQYDGFAVNRNSWTNTFLNYDYIGAPWIAKSGHNRVGNGGFSLRSLKLQRAIEQENICLIPNKKFGMQEDRIICDYNKDLLESKYDINFASIDIASQFSFEKVKSDKKPFGFHGFWNVPYFLNKHQCDYYIKNLNDPTNQKSKRILNNINRKKVPVIL